jgi:hypothetical protein
MDRVGFGRARGLPMQTERSASRTWSAVSSAVEYTATDSSSSSRHARTTRSAISLRLAISTRRND